MTSSRPPASANLPSPARNHRRPPGPAMTEQRLPAGHEPASPAAIPVRGRPAPGLPTAGQLYTQTHGCQMNEYDSARMADVLARSAEHTSELKPLMRISSADFVMIKNTQH